jgi:CubicO group peptidase (beta-lactamase class C family)
MRPAPRLHGVLAAALAGWLGALPAAGAQTAPESPPAIVRGDVAAAIHAELNERATQGFGGALLIESHGKIILDAGYGWANRAARIPFTTRTIGQIGSLTKQFTAAALVDLWSQGKVDFEAPLGKVLPGVPGRAAAITLAQLLTHTSGLPDSCGDDFEPCTHDELIAKCLAQPARAPGGKFVYSNLGYSVVAAVVEEVSGQTLEDQLTSRFFARLGMQHTGYTFPAALHDSLAIGYGAQGPQPPISDRLAKLAGRDWHLRGNGGMQSSVHDLYTWYRALREGTALADTARQVLFAPHVWRDATVAYGYGWFVRTGAHGECLQASHTGSDGVFFAAIVWRPVEQLFYVLISNNGEESGAAVASSVLRRCRVGPSSAAK